MDKSASPKTYHTQFADRSLKRLRDRWRWVDWHASSGFQETSTGESYTYVGASRTGKHTIQANVSVSNKHIQLEVFCGDVSIASKTFGFSGISYEQRMDEAFVELVNRMGHMCALQRPYIFPVLAGLQQLIFQSQQAHPSEPPEVVEQRLTDLVEEWLDAHNDLDEPRQRLIYDPATLEHTSLLGTINGGTYKKCVIQVVGHGETTPGVHLTKGDPLVIEVVFVDDASDEVEEESTGDVDDKNLDFFGDDESQEESIVELDYDERLFAKDVGWYIVGTAVWDYVFGCDEARDIDVYYWDEPPSEKDVRVLLNKPHSTKTLDFNVARIDDPMSYAMETARVNLDKLRLTGDGILWFNGEEADPNGIPKEIVVCKVLHGGDRKKVESYRKRYTGPKSQPKLAFIDTHNEWS